MDNVDFDDSGMALTVRSKEKERTTKLDDVYERFAKLVFIFDNSASMRTRLYSLVVDQYTWPADLMTKLKKEAEEVAKKLASMHGDDDDDSFGPGLVLDVKEKTLLKMVDITGQFTASKEDAQHLILESEAPHEFEVYANFTTVTYGNDENGKGLPPSRIEALKKLAMREIERRMEKFPGAQIAVIRFEGFAELLTNDGSIGDILACIEALDGSGGNTRILEGIRGGLIACEKKPSPVGVHHFIVVSDGEDGNCNYGIASWIPTLKNAGVVLDYIHVGDRKHNEGLGNACKALGGEFTTVTTEKDLDSRFVEAVQRKCLPAPAEAK